MSAVVERLPDLSDSVVPPVVLGVGDLAEAAYQGLDHAGLVTRVGGFHGDGGGPGRLYDLGIAAQLAFDRAEGLRLQAAALEQSLMFRLQTGGGGLRLLAVCAAGDLMVNAPLDFITNAIDVRLDLLYVLPGRALPEVIPDHDVAFFAVGEADPLLLARLAWLFDAWPRPVLNDPRLLAGLARDALAGALADIPGICSPPAVAATRAALEAGLHRDGQDFQPRLIRPAGSHAGHGLELVRSAAEMAEYLRVAPSRDFVVTAFEDYAGPDGYYRKSRVAFIDRVPYLCHMAVSTHWMVHYLNAGMTESAWKREEEARAMAEFDAGFARRHAAAFAALHERLGFDYYSIDCGETRDGRLLVFEADVAAIIHLMDPVEMFPYKHPQMRRVFDAFGAMLRRRVRPATRAA